MGVTPVSGPRRRAPHRAGRRAAATARGTARARLGGSATPHRVIVLSAEGRHFSGGMDLATFADINSMLETEPGRAAYALRQLILKLQGSLSSLENVHVPVIAVTHGACLGGAIDLITACDMRVASADTSFGVEEIHIGMAADVGTLQRLPKLIPPAIVSELAYTGRRFSAEEAKTWGLVNSVHADQ
mgnify:CR=1 FL=1